MNNRKIRLIALVVLLLLIIVIFLQCSKDDNLTTENFEKKFEDVTNGEVVLQNYSVEKGEEIAYFVDADLDDKLSIMGLAQKNKEITGVMLSNDLTGEPLNEIDFGNFKTYMKYLMKLCDPDLSDNEIENIIENEIYYTDSIFSGGMPNYEFSYNDNKYMFSIGDGLYMFNVVKEDKIEK